MLCCRPRMVVRWDKSPKYIAIPNPKKSKSTYAEENVIRRAVAIINRSLPESKRLSITYTDETFALGRSPDIEEGSIHAEIWAIPEDFGGEAWTDGTKGFASVQEDVMSSHENAVTSNGS